MGSRELAASLRKEAGEKEALIWREAEAEAGGLEDETRRKVEALRQDYEARGLRAAEAVSGRILAGAQQEARALRLEAETALAKRLLDCALEGLGGLRDEGYEAVFRALAAELPQVQWQEVRVNPKDMELAARYLPGAAVKTDEAISGGLEATDGDGRFVVINTFEKRLQRAWPEMMIGAMGDAYGHVRPDRA